MHLRGTFVLTEELEKGRFELLRDHRRVKTPVGFLAAITWAVTTESGDPNRKAFSAFS